MIKQNVHYYADATEWYIDELLNKRQMEMTREKLFHLSHIYAELSNVKAQIIDYFMSRTL